MSSEVWKIGQNLSAEDCYKEMQAVPIQKEIIATKVLTKICEEMNAAFNEVIEDQTEYIVELNNEFVNINLFKSEQDEKIQKLISEIKVLEQKKENGTITEEEQEELENKKGELCTLKKGTDSTVAESNNKIKNMTSEQDAKYRSKVKIAQDYGETTVEKGKPLADTHVSSGFFKKLFGNTGKGKKAVGEKAVKVGNELLDKVSESVDLDKNIETKHST